MKQNQLKLKIYFCLSIISVLSIFSPLISYAQELPVQIDNNVESESGETAAWTGIDVSIVGKYATKYGRPPRDPYINTDQGDLLLFVFTLSGVIGGFVMGFNARKLFFEKPSQDN